MTLNELKESIDELIESYPESGDMRVCFFDAASQYSHQLWGPEIKYLEKENFGSEHLYESIEELEDNELSSEEIEAVIVL